MIKATHSASTFGFCGDGVNKLFDEVFLLRRLWAGIDRTIDGGPGSLLSSPVPFFFQVSFDQHQDVVDVDFDLLDELDLEHHVVVDRLLSASDTLRNSAYRFRYKLW